VEKVEEMTVSNVRTGVGMKKTGRLKFEGKAEGCHALKVRLTNTVRRSPRHLFVGIGSAAPLPWPVGYTTPPPSTSFTISDDWKFKVPFLAGFHSGILSTPHLVCQVIFIEPPLLS
jgi:hypothetical protein